MHTLLANIVLASKCRSVKCVYINISSHKDILTIGPKMTENAKTHQNAYFEMAPKAWTLLHTYFQNISMHSVSQEIIFSVANNREGGGDFRLEYPLLGPQGNITEPNWHIAHLDHASYKLRLQLGLWDTYWDIFFRQSPPVEPQGVQTGPKLHMHN